MKHVIKKCLIWFLSITLVLPSFSVCTYANEIPKEEATLLEESDTKATSRSVDEALAWVKSLEGKAYDYDKVYGAQCVDLIKGYYNYLGVPVSNGNGCDYATNTLPTAYGWQRIKGGVPQKGDILVYNGNSSNPAGHVAIYEGGKTIWHGRLNGVGKVQKTTTIAYNGFNNSYWGLIRPKFSDGGSSESTIFTSVSTTDLTETSAKINAELNAVYSVSTCGFYYGTSKTNLTKVVENANTKVQYLWYSLGNNSKWLSTLKKGTTYYYKFFVTINGKEHQSNVYNFTTKDNTVYTITYKLNGGTNHSKNPATYKRSSSAIVLNNPSRTGYEFAGWYSDSGFTKKVTQIPSGSGGNIILYAKWSAVPYSIEFHGNGAIGGSTARINTVYGQKVNLSQNNYVRNGYVFTGWNTKADGSGTAYAAGAQVSNLTTTKNGVITLYAQWKKEIYAISSAEIVLSQSAYVYDGEEKKPGVTVKYGNQTLVLGTDYTVAYVNNKAVGTATVTITGIGSYTGSVSRTFTISKASISNAVVTLSANSYIYDGNEKRPNVTVTLGNRVLIFGTDYTVVYQDNQAIGTAIVTVIGIGNYEGAVSKTFTIAGASLETAEVTLAKTKYNYNGKAKKPEVTVILGGKILVQDTDYTVSYENNKNIGTATVTITGKGQYAGTITKTFTIKLDKGATFKSGKYKYKVTGSSTVAFNGIVSTKTTKVTIPKTVKYGGKTFKVTAVASKALKGKTKVTQVTIGANVKSIGDSAFYGCKKLKNITIKTTKLQKVGKNALKGINSKATIKVPKSKVTAYKKLLKGKGQGSKVKIKK